MADDLPLPNDPDSPTEAPLDADHEESDNDDIVPSIPEE